MCLCMYQWWSIQFLWSISCAFCFPWLVASWLKWFTLSSLGCLTTWYTFCSHLAFHHDYNCLQHCICGDKTTTSRCWPSILRFICLVSRIIAIELLLAMIGSPFWLFMENLCPILIIRMLHHSYQQKLSVALLHS